MEENTNELIERTIVLLKPDAVQRGLVGRILERFENAGLKIVAMKMLWADEQLADRHYGDLGERKGENIKKQMVDFISHVGPVVAMVIEGIEAIDEVRMMVGSTEPKSATPGTIRGDFAHVSYNYSNKKNIGVKNLIHASDSKENADKEIYLWFSINEIYSYKTVNDIHILE